MRRSKNRSALPIHSSGTAKYWKNENNEFLIQTDGLKSLLEATANTRKKENLEAWHACQNQKPRVQLRHPITGATEEIWSVVKAEGNGWILLNGGQIIKEESPESRKNIHLIWKSTETGFIPISDSPLSGSTYGTFRISKETIDKHIELLSQPAANCLAGEVYLLQASYDNNGTGHAIWVSPFNFRSEHEETSNYMLQPITHWEKLAKTRREYKNLPIQTIITGTKERLTERQNWSENLPVTNKLLWTYLNTKPWERQSEWQTATIENILKNIDIKLKKQEPKQNPDYGITLISALQTCTLVDARLRKYLNWFDTLLPEAPLEALAQNLGTALNPKNWFEYASTEKTDEVELIHMVPDALLEKLTWAEILACEPPERTAFKNKLLPLALQTDENLTLEQIITLLESDSIQKSSPFIELLAKEI